MLEDLWTIITCVVLEFFSLGHYCVIMKILHSGGVVCIKKGNPVNQSEISIICNNQSEMSIHLSHGHMMQVATPRISPTLTGPYLTNIYSLIIAFSCLRKNLYN